MKVFAPSLFYFLTLFAKGPLYYVRACVLGDSSAFSEANFSLWTGLDESAFVLGVQGTNCSFPVIHNGENISTCIGATDENALDAQGWCYSRNEPDTVFEIGVCSCLQDVPTVSPTPEPTSIPTSIPSNHPTLTPSVSPTSFPTTSPSVHPTSTPSLTPTSQPTNSPTASPTVSLFPTVRVEASFRLGQGTSVNDDLKKSIQCFVNYLFGQLNPVKRAWAEPIPLDDRYPAKLVPFISIACETSAPSPALNGRLLKQQTACTSVFHVHTSRNPINQSAPLGSSATQPGSAPIAVQSAQTVLEAGATLSSFQTPTETPTPIPTITVLEFLKLATEDDESPFYKNNIGLDSFQHDGTHDVQEIEPTPAKELTDDDKYCEDVHIEACCQGTVPNSTEVPVSIGTTSSPSTEDGSEKLLTTGQISIVAVSLSFLALLVLLFAFRRRRMRTTLSSLSHSASSIGLDKKEGGNGKLDDDAMSTPEDGVSKLLAQFRELRIDMKSLKLGRVIGHGANGRIFRARYAGSSAAVKELYAEQISDMFNPNADQNDDGEAVNTAFANRRLESILREVKLLRMLRHPHIIQLFGCTFQQTSNSGVWRFLVVMELAACSLLDLLDPEKGRIPKELQALKFDLRKKVFFARQICSGCAYIHDNNMVHFDIKPANILLDFSGNAKICDLGIAKISSNDTKSIDATITALGGTPPYMSPELLRGDTENIGPPVDIYAFGVVLWQMFHKKSPQPPEWTMPKLFHEVLANNYRPEIDPEVVDSKLTEVIKLCWHQMYKRRPTFHALMKIFEEYLSSLEKSDASDESEDEDDQYEPFRLGADVVVWDYCENEYIPATITQVISVPLRETHKAELGEPCPTEDSVALVKTEDSAEFIKYRYEVKMRETGVVKADVPQTDILDISAKQRGQGAYKSVAGIALAHVVSGKTIKMTSTLKGVESFGGMGSSHQPGKSMDPGRTYMLSEGKLSMQGIVLHSEGMAVAGSSLQSIKKDRMVRFAMLGQGACGSVFAALCLDNFSIVAVKEISILERSTRHQTVKELQVLWKNFIHTDKEPEKGKKSGDAIKAAGQQSSLSFPQMRCPFIVGFYGAYFDEVNNAVSLVMENMDGGSLQDVLDNQRSTTDSENLNTESTVSGAPLIQGISDEKILGNISRNILMALAFIHDQNLVHLDIKPSNILLNVNGIAKLSDFGLAKSLEESNGFRAQTFVGTIRYMSPERLRGEKYGYASDIWSFALTMLTVTLGRYPTDFVSATDAAETVGTESSKKVGNSDYWALLEAFRKGVIPSLPTKGRVVEEAGTRRVTKTVEFSTLYQDFLERCLDLDPGKRPSAADLLEHPWLQTFSTEVTPQTLEKPAAAILAVNRTRLAVIVKKLLELYGSKLQSLDEKLFHELAVQLYLPVETVLAEIDRGLATT